MKATELRIDNWVKWNYEESSDGNAYPVEFGYELDDIKNNPNIVKPIPLTEEWLVKFGFENNSMNLDEEGFLHLDISFIGGVNVYINDMEYPHINHVHQLQNLYFALTGQEL